MLNASFFFCQACFIAPLGEQQRAKIGGPGTVS